MDERIAIPRAELDLSQFPVVVLSECGLLSDEERVHVMEALDELVERSGRHALVLDLTQADVVPPSQRAYIGDAWEMRGDQIAEKWAAIAVLVCEPVVTHLPKAAFWLKIAPVPARMFADREEAMTWARGCVNLGASGAMPILADLDARRRVAGGGRL